MRNNAGSVTLICQEIWKIESFGFNRICPRCKCCSSDSSGGHLNKGIDEIVANGVFAIYFNW